jgi:hypothetical protein
VSVTPADAGSATFSFKTKVATGTAYAITVQTLPFSGLAQWSR